MDPRFTVKVLAQTPNPQTIIYAAMHQDYSEDFIADARFPSEQACGEIAVKCLLSGDKGHYGPIEHPTITFACGWFPHSTMQQARTHRVGTTFDCQSFRYTGSRIVAVAKGLMNIEDVFYLRPTGDYTDRFGKRYTYTQALRENDRGWCLRAAKRYQENIEAGMAEEHARGIIPFDVRQHFVVSFNIRSLMHFLDLRAKKDAQLEIQQLCELMLPHFESWCPEIYGWYSKNRLGKARLSP